jgi:hypothetical protein
MLLTVARVRHDLPSLKFLVGVRCEHSGEAELKQCCVAFLEPNGLVVLRVEPS